MKSDGTPWRAIVHIEDIARAFIAVVGAKRELVHDQAFNVGQTKENYRVSEMAEIVAADRARTAGSNTRRRRPGPALLSRELRQACRARCQDFQPQWTARDGAKQVYETIRQGRAEPSTNSKAPRYARLPHMKKLIADGVVDERFRYTHGTTIAA